MSLGDIMAHRSNGKRLPIVTLRDGEILIVVGDWLFTVYHRRASKAAALEAGERLYQLMRNRKVSSWRYASSIDFPDACHCPALDYRTLVDLGVHRAELRDHH
jgi:hypothetical protein